MTDELIVVRESEVTFKDPDELMFVRLHEYNDWEGEQWDFWLQLTGNEDQLGKLIDLLVEEERRQGTDLWYTFHPQDIEPESAVDLLVKYAESGYMDSHNKIKGVFTCPDWLGEDAENLYKGGIYRYFKNDE